MIRRPPRSTLDRSSAASDVYKRQIQSKLRDLLSSSTSKVVLVVTDEGVPAGKLVEVVLSLIHISEPTRPY